MASGSLNGMGGARADLGPADDAALPDVTLLDGWLEQWEQALKQGQPVTLDQFIEEHCQGATPSLIEAFRAQAPALRSMDAHLGRAASSTQLTGEGDSQDTGGPAAVRLDLQLGAEPVPGYRLQTPLGHGGFGQVWRATAPGDLPVALKFVPLQTKGRVEERALDILKKVRHPNLLAMMGAWQQGDHLIIAMELADGTLLDRFHEAVRGGQPGIPGPELLGYLTDAAKGLDYLNEPRQAAAGQVAVGVPHRDVKPQNLLLLGGCVKVGDFGLARLLRDEGTGHSGRLTPAYAAPEFFDGRTCAQSDQYSLAVTYCHLRGGRLPFAGTSAQMMKGHLTGEPDLSMLPPEEQPVLARALAKEPQSRWPNCGAFVEALRNVQHEARPEPDAETLRQMLLNDLNNVELRRRYLAVRTTGLALADYDQVRIPLVKLVLSFALLSVFALFAELISQWSSAPPWQTRLFQALLLVALGASQLGDVGRLTLRRKYGSQFGPLPPDCPLDETEIRRRFLGE